ncbi:SUMF1/EgtB/PvdO family nonheme iron enzyme [Motiliproteus sp. MSK22-1]|uniref:SUMF1/EgtB/PvdO family nonheme iron enzyme n=1 Tax=Motiliproteus sp. MSK22-1 TaxID=1897630 RepID=UPI0009762C10|nr:SUMF1/EgtB/PvdO family nonheme iron enzyme [Motiliproteus sp. MSK22-1]OMH36129.1 hypothetical protein BGP75_10260 [Motiliproteus sp. MSK22-1]
MADPRPLDFSSLRKGMVLGPEHHQFKLIKPVSNSPIGQVWHAQDLSTAAKDKEPDKVALEVINPLLLKSNALETFKTQVTLCKQLDNIHIAKTYGYFMSREGWLFTAMEPISTRSLAKILMEDGYQHLSTEKARIILIQVAKALGYAHNKRISHGDLTPWNIIITPKTGAKLVNFAFRQPLLQQIQQQGMRILNTEFHAPEAFDHVPLANSADIYSFACLTYQLFTGHPPFSPEDPIDSRDIESLEPPKQLSAEQWSVLKPALSDNPGDRPATAAKLMQELFPPKTVQSPESESPAESGKGISDKLKGSKSSARSALPHISFARLGIAALIFTAGLISGYLLASYYLDKQNEELLAKFAEVQKILTLTPSLENKTLLNQKFAELRILNTDPALISAIGAQVEGYKVRLQNKNAERNRPKSIIVSDSAIKPTTSKPEETEPGSAFTNGSVFKDEILPNIFGPNMVVIPSGKFKMGDRNRRGDDNELPIHQVTIRRPFALSQHEITFAEYDLFAINTGRPLPDDEGWGRANRPVINVSWNDANAYADWVRRQTGLAYRLPTEAEWEYSARAGSSTAFWWGNDKGINNAACDDCGSQFDGIQTAPVGSFKANPYGLYDMTGNIYEWVSDCYNDNYEDAPNDGSSWNVGQCNYRVMRGGSWYDISRLIRSASRYRHPANSSRNSWGFRLALDLEN